MDIEEYKRRVINRIRFGAPGLKKEFWDALAEVILSASETGGEYAETIDRTIFMPDDLRSMGYD